MAVMQPRYSKEEFARRGQLIYKRDIRPRQVTDVLHAYHTDKID